MVLRNGLVNIPASFEDTFRHSLERAQLTQTALSFIFLQRGKEEGVLEAVHVFHLAVSCSFLEGSCVWTT